MALVSLLLPLLLSAPPAAAAPPFCCGGGIGYIGVSEHVYAFGLEGREVRPVVESFREALTPALLEERPDVIDLVVELHLLVGADGGVDRVHGDGRLPDRLKAELRALSFPPPPDGVALVDVRIIWRHPQRKEIMAFRQQQAREQAAQAAEAAVAVPAREQETAAAVAEVEGLLRPSLGATLDARGDRLGSAAPAEALSGLPTMGRRDGPCPGSEWSVAKAVGHGALLPPRDCDVDLGEILAPVVGELLACDPIGRPGATTWTVHRGGAFLEEAEERDPAVLACMDDALMSMKRHTLWRTHRLELFAGEWARWPETDRTGKRLR